MKTLSAILFVLSASAMSLNAHAVSLNCKNADYQLTIGAAGGGGGWDYSNVSLTALNASNTYFKASTDCSTSNWPADVSEVLFASQVACGATSGRGYDAGVYVSVTSFKVQSNVVAAESGKATTQFVVTVSGARGGATGGATTPFALETSFSSADPKSSCN